MGKRVKDEQFDFSDIVDEEEFDFSDVVEDEYDFSDIVEEPSTAGAISEWLETRAPLSKVIFDFGRTIYSGIVDTVPQTVAQANEVRKSSMYSHTLKDYLKNHKAVDFQNYVREREPEYKGVSGFFTPFKGVEEYADKYGKEFLESQGLGEKIEQFEAVLPEVTQRRKDLEAYVDLQKQEAEDKLRGVVQDYRDINSLTDFGSYVAGLAGQAAYQIPLAAATRGGSSFIMESATVYDKQLDRLAEEHGISREEVIERNLDAPAQGQAYAVLAAGLDAASAGNVIGAFRRQGGSLLKKFMVQQIEGVTEATQGVLEDLGAGGKLAENLTSEGIATRANEYFGGVVGGSFNFFGKGSQKKLADKAINETSDTGDANINGMIDAEATLTPQEEEVIKLKHAEENLEEVKTQEEKLIKQEESKTESTENKEKSAENKDSKSAESAEKDLVTSQFEAENNQRVRELEEQVKNIEPDQDITELVTQLNEARQERDNARIAFEETKKKPTKAEKAIKLTAAEAIKAQFQSVTKGLKKGVKIGVEETNKLIDKVRTTLKEHNLSDKQRDAILTKVRNTDINAYGTSKRSVSALNQFIDNVVKDADYADKIQEAKQLNRKMRKLAKNKTSNLQPYRTLAKAFSSINPEDAFINIHLKHARNIIGALSSPTRGYSSTDISEIEEYAANLRSQIEEGQVEAETKEDTADKSGEKLKELQAIASGSLERLTGKDLSDFDESDRSTIEMIKKIDPSKLDRDQLVTVIKVVDNIVDNDSLVNTARVEAVSNFQSAVDKIKDLFKGRKTFGIGAYARALSNNARIFDAIALDTEVGYKLRQILGAQDLYAAGSRVEKYIHNKTKELAKLVNKVNGGALNFDYKSNVLHISNRVKMRAYSLFLRRPVGTGNEHIPQIKKNIEQTIAVWEEAGQTEKVNAWREVYEQLRNVDTVEDAMAQFKSKEPGLYKIWNLISNTFKSDVNDKLRETTENVHNAAYIEEDNYSHIRMIQVLNRKSAKEHFIDGVSTKPADKVKARQSKTSLASTRKMSSGQAYSDDFIGDQLRALRESMYDIEASKVKMRMGEILYSKEFEDAVGRDNALFIQDQVEKSDLIQREMGGIPTEEYLQFVNAVAQFSKQIGAAKALGSTLGQVVKQIPPVVIKAFNNHLIGGSTGILARAMSLRITPNIQKLLDNSQIGTAGLRLGGIERGNSVSFNLAPGAQQKAARILQKFYNMTNATTRGSLAFLTGADAAAKRRIGLSYYLKKLKDLGVTKVNLEEEYKLQSDPIRQEAVAYMEHMMSITQTPSNPAELSALSRNTGNQALNIIKTVLLPFSQYSLEAKARLVQDVRKTYFNPTKENVTDVLGDLEEIALFGVIQLYVMNFYKDAIKGVWEELFGVEPPEKDEEDEERLERQKAASAVGQGLATASPIAIGTIGEATQNFLFNRFAHAVYKARTDENLSYAKWKRETGGLFYDSDVDWGLLGIGFEPALESGNAVIDLVDLKGDGEITITDKYGNTKILTPSKNLERLMYAKVAMEGLSTIGINEADWFNQLRKVYKEQLNKELKEAPTEE